MTSGLSVGGLFSSVGVAGEANLESLMLPSHEYGILMREDGQNRNATSLAQWEDGADSENHMDTENERVAEGDENIETITGNVQDSIRDSQMMSVWSVFGLSRSTPPSQDISRAATPVGGYSGPSVLTPRIETHAAVRGRSLPGMTDSATVVYSSNIPPPAVTSITTIFDTSNYNLKLSD